MAEESYVWGGTAIGDASLAPYDNDEWTDIWRRLRQRGTSRTLTGVIPGDEDELQVAQSGGATVEVPAGSALVDGVLYINDSAISFGTAGVSVFYLCGLRKTFAGQTVRAFFGGPYATEALAFAALVQTDGVTWEIPLAIVETTAGGGVQQVIDYRNMVATPLGSEQLIREIVVSGATASIQFANLNLWTERLFKHFVVRYRVYSDNPANTWFEMRFNGDTGNNHVYTHRRRDAGSGAEPFGDSQLSTFNVNHILIGECGDRTFGMGTIEIHNARDPNFYLMAMGRFVGWDGQGTGLTDPNEQVDCEFWGFLNDVPPAQLSQLDFFMSAGNIQGGSRISLYGVY